MNFNLLVTILAILNFACNKHNNLPKQAFFKNNSCDNVNAQKYCVTMQFAGGRLGNQLFEVATALSIAKDNNCQAVFPMFTQKYRWEEMITFGVAPNILFSDYLKEEDNAIFSKQRLGSQRDEAGLKCFEEQSIFAEDIKIKREDYSKIKLPTKLVTKPYSKMIMTAGQRIKDWGAFNFFSYKIFEHNKEYIQKTFGPSLEQKQALIEKFKGLGLNFVNKNSCAIHIRRGDRVKGVSKYVHPVAGVKYFKEAIELMEILNEEKGRKIDIYIVFSDDIIYAKGLFNKDFKYMLKNKEIFFVDFKKHHQKDYEDLWLISMANHQIITNSTFSWWGGYLNTNPDKIVIQPKKWWLMPFNRFGIKYETNGMSPSQWHIIDKY
jgi:hypothetical protein